MEAHEPVVALLVIRQGLCDAHDYGIMRCLERRFGLMQWGEIKAYLLAKGYVAQLDKSQVPAYALTAAGEAFSTRFREQALTKLRRDPYTHTEHTQWMIERL